MFLCLNEYPKKLNSVEVIALPQGIHFSPNFIRVIMPFAEGFIESQSSTMQAEAFEKQGHYDSRFLTNRLAQSKSFMQRISNKEAAE